ncbi:MAG TPA: MBL fold metallo-hydrolase [Thermoanaerobaculia bacterium]|nr:MBL fold metallo-hydrolase [Thermoanaerobaculia bacterium]
MNVHQLRAPNPGPFTLDGTNSYLIGRVVIDPGPAIDEHVQRILNKAPDLEAILITHRHGDHAPAARSLRERSAARVYAPQGVLDDSVVDVRLEDGMMVELDSFRIEAIATPGHTAEHFCFLSAEGDLFTGDMVLGAGTSAIFPPDGNMGDYVASLRKLIERKPSRIHPGHGPVRDDAMELLEQYLSHREMRDAQIASVLENEALSIPSLRAKIYPDLGPGLEGAADAQLLAHLLYLIERGMVIEEQGRYRRVMPQ